ncbi:uncharacterized protein LOC131311005 isoform X2 [Rhododendron vialii]|uniref:uncharacterized protein LOC131311005 isoform X2 n=1 Tax=Rhododendron vialii TaxID=182163 RepID=UPI00265F9D89|nr:uncharacterized protein LOC131311005 isoform X2 [Rhododendron vialii]
MLAIGGVKADSGTKLYLSNLDYGVSVEDIEFPFSRNGELQQYSIHYDWKGRSKGTGEVVFARQSDALAAIDRYDNRRLHRKRMKIELVVGVRNCSPAAMPLVTKDLVENPFRCKIPKDVVVLKKLRKGKHESLRNYVRRYWAMYDEVEKNTCSEQLTVAFFKQSLPHGDRLWTTLVMSPVSSIAELYSRVSRYVMLEDVLGCKGYAKREYTL